MHDRAEAAGLSVALISAIYLALSFALGLAKGRGLPVMGAYDQPFEVLGTFGLLGSFFILGMGGKEPVYETMVLVLSVAAIFASPWKQSKVFLYAGAVFLVIYVFSTGAEYFKDAIGWPLTLLVSGLLSMLIAYGAERVKKTSFQRKTG